MSSLSFREYIPTDGHPRLGKVDFNHYDAYSWVDFGLQQPMIRALWDGWQSLYNEPFRGITTNGEQLFDLFSLRAEGAPIKDMVDSATLLLQEASKDPNMTAKLRYAVDADEWRCWSNPEFYFARHGVRFEEAAEPLVQAALGLIKASLSREGYSDVLAIMRINEFSGSLVDAPRLMNERSYNFILFGEPASNEPWGWSLWGHHLSMCALVLGTQMVISPVFRGCEPSSIDSGVHEGTEIFASEMRLAIRVMQLLSSEQRKEVILYNELESSDMPEGFPHPADGRNLTGAYEDNKVIPYTGGRVSTFSVDAQEALLELVEKFIDYMPPGPLVAKMGDVRRHLDETWLAWMGRYGEQDVFHFRVHSPVIVCEFDHENGMYLTNDHPSRFHIHTVVRTPNGNDYGKELIRLWRTSEHAWH